jgi:hypothetical protein
MSSGAMRDILRLSTAELLTLYKALEAPGLGEMQGEYAAQTLQQPNVVATLAGRFGLNDPLYPGKWLSKSFRPVSERGGRGYNSFRHFGRVVDRFPMATHIAPSRYDGRPAFQLIYRAYHSLFGAMHMVDEVRRLEAGRYLGIGTFGFTDAQRRMPCPFLLTGPVGSWRDDIGRERAGFNPASELPAVSDRSGSASTA